uniref:RNA-directed DNA polymerase, eukaryota n=1 Tax=Tanacetum cinerariifolium TaxID=118510 RepID=A0A6L2L3G4_TANCI|nr:RNA-directed DNA polymerase, eukaryota [Tanacetum cinerariifolium]
MDNDNSIRTSQPKATMHDNKETVHPLIVKIKSLIKESNEELLLQRAKLLKDLHDLNTTTMIDMAQKAKVRWSIEGDENLKFFHEIINKKRSQLVIRRVLVNGDCIADPPNVKKEFLNHFANRFSNPASLRFLLDVQFENRLLADQKDDLERDVTHDEIRRAVWDCGTNKSPGPDGFTFEFRRYWSIIKK